MAGKVPRMPNVPLGLISTAITGIAGLSAVGYLGYNSIYSGAWRRGGRGGARPGGGGGAARAESVRGGRREGRGEVGEARCAVKGGERAIIFNRLQGVKDVVVEEGTHFMLPWFDRPIVFDVRTRPRVVQTLSGSRDLQMVQISLRVLTRPDIKALPTIYRRIGEDYDEKVLPSIVNEVLKQVIAQFTAPQLLTQREQVSRKIRQSLMERASDFHIILEDVSITDLQFGREFTAAVERKQVAQQEAERARFIVEKAIQDKRSTIIRSKGEARAAEMIGQAIKDNPGFVQLKRIDTAKDIANLVANSSNTVYLPADNLLLNLLADDKALHASSSSHKAE
jgi:prohibitin 2